MHDYYTAFILGYSSTISLKINFCKKNHDNSFILLYTE